MGAHDVATHTALDQFKLKAEVVISSLPASQGTRVSCAAIWRAFGASEDVALSAYGARTPREECLRFLSECLAITRGPAQQESRASFLQAIARAAPAQQLFAVLESVLRDRHATQLEVVITLELLQSFSADAQTQHQQAQLQLHGLQHLRAKGIGSDPLRRYLVGQASRFKELKEMPQPSLKAPPSTISPEIPLNAVPADAYGALIISLLRNPVDDGTSIRLYEKALSVACAGHLPGEWLSLAPDNLRKAITSFNVLRAPCGEHGSIIPTPTERTGLLATLVWRAVDDPEPAINTAALDLLRSVLDVSVADCSEVSSEDLGKIIQSFYDFFAPWLFQPFCSARLQPTTSIPDPKSVTMLLDRGDGVSETPQGDNRRELARQLCPWIVDPRVGGDSTLSKYSKQAIVEFVIATHGTHLVRIKYIQLRLKIFTRVSLSLGGVRLDSKILFLRDVFPSYTDATTPLLP